MLNIHIDKAEVWDEVNEEFIKTDGYDLCLEHSLLSISEWEAKYHKSFINSEKTPEETFDYIKMMVVGEKPKDDRVFLLLKKSDITKIGDYINDPMTATTISDEDEKEIAGPERRNKFTTSEEIYSWMCAQQIPFECEKWHLNRLIVLIKLCALNNKPKDDKKKKMTSSDLALRRAKMQAARAKYAKH